jgi:sugar lactone lactonase YvrE
MTDDGELSPIVSEYEERPFNGPSSVAVDSAQTVYFTDSGHVGSTSLQNARGSVFAITGSSQVLQPLAFECLAHPCGVALAPPPPHDPTLAPVYVAEMMRNRVLRFVQSPKGVYHCSVFHQFAGGVGPSGIACDAAGHVFVARFEYHGALPIA